MASFLYFVPEAPSEAEALETIRGLGFPHLFETGRPTVIMQKGPCGDARGALLWPNYGATPQPGYYPDEQVWCAACGGRVWIGYERARKPAPDDLARKELVSGYRLEIEGREWIVPVARLLPGTLRLNADGSGVETQILPRYRELSEKALALRVRLQEGGGEVGDLERFDTATEALSINYRLGRWEASALELWTTQSALTAVWFLIDEPLLRESGGPEKNPENAAEAANGGDS